MAAPGGLKESAQKTLRAFAEALLPPGGKLPAAADVDLVAAADQVASTLPPRSRLGVNLGLRALEYSTLPRLPFSRLPVQARARHIRRFENSRLGIRRDLLLLAKSMTCFAYGRAPEVIAALGTRTTCERGPGTDDPAWDPIAPPLDPDSLHAGEGVERCDVVIVGSGAGGAVAARVLAEAGLDVIVLEQGGYSDRNSYNEDPAAPTPSLYRDGGVTMCEGRPMIPMPVGRCVGGTTVVNSGTCFRAPNDILARWRDEFGIPWTASLETEFEQVENSLRVQPVDREHAGRNAQLCAEGAEALGVSHGPIPRNAGHVSCCSSCPTGCALDAKQAMHVSELPRAVAAGARVRSLVRVEEVILENGRAAGVRAAAGEDTRPYEVRSRAVVLAGGALGTPELLLRQGIANSSGAVGRHLRIHPVCWVGGLFDEQVDGWEGVMQSWYVDEWHDRGITLEATFTPPPYAIHWLHGAGTDFKEKVEKFNRLGMVGVQYEDHLSEGRVRPSGRDGVRVSYKVHRDDAADIRFGIARSCQVMFAAGATEAYPTIGRLGSIKPGEEVAKLEQARHAVSSMRLEAFHPMGSARMGGDPSHSVVGPDGQSHDVPGLYVADASIFPTAVRVNPMVTIMAMARRISTGLADALA
ncbi:MAG: hypothetical protein QOG62_417 [Thermoleophilaceae bacterium]|nr:hypothetical protein [Thermoleophilaceae bacterium]